MLKEAMLYEKLSDQAVCCHICQRFCEILKDERGYCRTRQNRGGRLFSQIYGEVSSWRRAPIEIKPVYHYLPGSYALSLGSVGCNFLCPGCQNWEISFALSQPLSIQTEYISPEKALELAQDYHCQGISWTYNEPTLWFEYTLECARLAKARGFYTNYVTNGYLSPEALDTIGPYLDIFRLDIKGFTANVYKKIAHIRNWEGILAVASRAKKRWQMHVEVVTNLIPGINDDLGQLQDLATWIKSELGSDTPWHITRFSPHWKFSHLCPTPIEKLEEIRDMAMSDGLKFVYIGNVSAHPANHTYCPGCGKIVVQRDGWGKVICKLTSNRCPFCGTVIAGRFQ